MSLEVVSIHIEKHSKHLSVYSYIDFGDKNFIFCGMPYVYLTAYKETDGFWDNNSIGIAIHDKDDFDIGLVYKTDSKHFLDVLHELINWMIDHEQGISLYEKIWKPYDFFPDCGCERERW